VKRARVELPVREAAGGFYAAVDGVEGSGKTTQVEALAKWLRGWAPRPHGERALHPGGEEDCEREGCRRRG